MTRLIKFRTWDKGRKKMRQEQMWWTGFGSGDWIEFISERGSPYPTQGFEIMQFTGLTDKNGKEIYEGDWPYRKGKKWFYPGSCMTCGKKSEDWSDSLDPPYDDSALWKKHGKEMPK